MSRSVVLCLAALLVIPAGAAAFTPIAEIPDSSATYLEVPLPHDVYRYSSSSGLMDLAVIDRQGNSLPSRIVTVEQTVKGQGERLPLTFFPVTAGDEPGSWTVQGGTRVQIDGRAIDIAMGEGEDAGGDPGEFYLIDIGDLKRPIANLELNWAAEGASRYLPVQISGSNDLQQWTELARETLVQLQADGQTLLRNNIALELVPDQYSYLRIHFPAQAEVQLTGIYGEEPEPVETVPPQRWELSGRLSNDQRPAGFDHPPIAAWEYQRDDKAPAQKVAIGLDRVSYADMIRIYSRPNLRQEWRLRFRGVWFNARVGEQWQHSEPATLRSNTDVYWRLELSRDLRDKASPTLIFQHPQRRLQFVGNNNGPYRIAIADEAPTRRTAAAAFSQVLGDKTVHWQKVNLQMVDDPDLPARDQAGPNWADILFWAVLVIAVVVLLVLAVRLSKQMESESDH